MDEIVIHRKYAIKFPNNYEDIFRCLKDNLEETQAKYIGDLAFALAENGGIYIDNGEERRADVFLLNIFDVPPRKEINWRVTTREDMFNVVDPFYDPVKYNSWNYYINIVPAVYPEGVDIYNDDYGGFYNLNLRKDGKVETGSEAYFITPSMVSEVVEKIGVLDDQFNKSGDSRELYPYDQPVIALNLEMLKDLGEILSPTQEVRSYLHLLNQQVGPENMIKLLPRELVDLIVYHGRDL